MQTTLSKPETELGPINGSETASYLTPLADFLETKDGYVLQVEMPGVSKGGLEVTVGDGELVIVGRRAPLVVKSRATYRESHSFDYRRVFELDPSIDAGRISARIDQGVLRLELPKSEAVKPHRIEVGG